MKSWMGVILFAVLLISCAGVRVEKVSPDDEDKEGLRFYRPHPYLLVTEGKNKVSNVQVIMLPDKNEEYVIRTFSGLGTVDIKVKLEEGWNLVELGEVSDSNAEGILSSLTGLLDVVTEFKALEADEELRPGLYRFDYEDGRVVGLTKVPLKFGAE